VAVFPASIDLSPGGTTTVYCNGSVYDLNGWDDLRNVSARIFWVGQGDGTTGDNNYRYVNSSCKNASGNGPNCMSKDGEANNASCVCSFSVWYYATNGTWQCNMTVGDSYAMNSSLLSNQVTMNTVLGIDVASILDFGQLSVTETSNYTKENITNWGNVPINTTVRGFGGDDATIGRNFSMMCELGNISNTYLRYSINTSALYTDMYNITNSSTMIPGSTIPSRTDDNVYGISRNATYWKLQIPTGIAGTCNGTLIFSAVDAS
jgi:hypothetical protein